MARKMKPAAKPEIFQSFRSLTHAQRIAFVRANVPITNTCQTMARVFGPSVTAFSRAAGAAYVLTNVINSLDLSRSEQDAIWRMIQGAEQPRFCRNAADRFLLAWGWTKEIIARERKGI